MSSHHEKLSLLELLSRQYPGYGREQLKAFVDCRQVSIEGETCTDARSVYPSGSTVDLHIPKYVSRGGLKLEHALAAWHLDVNGLIMLDAGSSTGGFTDCLLQNGAKAVHAVDVGYNQLDYKLRTDDRVIVHERQNIMLVESLDPRPDAAVADLSFRSITGAARHILSLTRNGWLVSLVKPQFEVPKGYDEFSGVVDDRDLLHRILTDVISSLRQEGLGLYGLEESPIQGKKGNREFLALLRFDGGMTVSEIAQRIGIVVTAF